ncbi:MAG: HPF/RaiA family ribosome-associated protein [Deltaproteobacteria bacterium]|nr:HPF/RaiA family ribosome-associated protein [Deltaproteobacteria bacterium]MBW2359933.1 HPF/RaiA family ribosome-associated protein [Deltaproteobacteria bacterium]
MSQRPTVVTNFKDLPHDDDVRDSIERRSELLAREFREISRIELTLVEDGANVAVHGHVTGKHSDVGAQAEASEAGPAADRVLDKLERQLRTLHDKRIFTQRRDAQRDPPKKRTAS